MADAQPERILKELAGLWGSMAKGESQGVNSGILRACAMTLVVAAKDDADAAGVGASLGELMHDHPSRAIVLRPSSEPGLLDARVFAQCWMPFGKRQQICCEQIEISASADQVGEISSVIVGIMAPDLPVVLWARNAEWLDNPGFRRVLPLIHKVVVDSDQLGPGALVRIQSLRKQGKLTGDLAWTRLTGARQTVSSVFADSGVIPRFKEITSIHVEAADDRIGTTYFAAWLATGAPKASLEFDKAAAGATASVIRLSGPALEIELELGPSLRVRVNQAEHRAMIPEADDCAAMREELSVLRPDPQFDRAFAIAEKLLTASVQ